MKISTEKTGCLIAWGLAFLAIPLSFLTGEDTDMHHRISPFIRYLNRVTALTAYSLFAVTFMVAVRAKWMERYFGGLDKMYQLHHQMGLTAFLLMCLHPLLLASARASGHTRRFLKMFFPVHHETAVNLGSYALWGMILLMLVTFIFKLTYRRWKISHKFTGLFFLLSLIHTFLLTSPFSENPLLWIYLCAISCIALAAFIYQTFLFSVLNPGIRGEVSLVRKINEDVLDIEFRYPGRNLVFRPGEFCFFRFVLPGIPAESHPFTLLPGKDQDCIGITVKALGDYTRRLYATLKPGAGVLIYGPYGNFVFDRSSTKQVWIAGGVGIAPFISWIRDLKQAQLPSADILLYYCVHKESDAVFMDELTAFEACSPAFRYRVISSDHRKRFSADEVLQPEEKTYFLCGPDQMCRDVIRQLKRKGVKADQIHYENFSF